MWYWGKEGEGDGKWGGCVELGKWKHPGLALTEASLKSVALDGEGCGVFRQAASLFPQDPLPLCLCLCSKEKLPLAERQVPSKQGPELLKTCPYTCLPCPHLSVGWFWALQGLWIYERQSLSHTGTGSK